MEGILCKNIMRKCILGLKNCQRITKEWFRLEEIVVVEQTMYLLQLKLKLHWLKWLARLDKLLDLFLRLAHKRHTVASIFLEIFRTVCGWPLLSECVGYWIFLVKEAVELKKRHYSNYWVIGANCMSLEKSSTARCQRISILRFLMHLIFVLLT